MSTIISLLNIQAEAQNNPMIENILLDAAGRVRSMRVLYDKLYHSEIKTALNIKEYSPWLTK